MGFISAQTLAVNKSAVFTVPSGCTFVLVKMGHNVSTLPTTITLGGTPRDRLGFMYNAVVTKYDLVALSTGY